MLAAKNLLIAAFLLTMANACEEFDPPTSEGGGGVQVPTPDGMAGPSTPTPPSPGDGDGDGHGTGGAPTPGPRQDFVLGQASDHHVFVPNPDEGSISVIDAETLSITRVRAGHRPSLVGAHPDHDTAVAIDTLNHRAYVLDADDVTGSAGVLQGLNALALDPTGTFAVLYYAKEYATPEQTAGPSRSLSVLTLKPNVRAHTVNLQQGVEGVAFTRDGKRAYLHGARGIARLVLADVADGRVTTAALLDFDELADDAVELAVLAPEADGALVSLRDRPELVWLDLERRRRTTLSLEDVDALDRLALARDRDAGTMEGVPLPDALAISEDGTRALASFSELETVLFLELPAALDDGDATIVDLTLTEGHALHISPGGDVAAIVEHGRDPPRLTLLDLVHPTDPPRRVVLSEVANGIAFADGDDALLLTHGPGAGAEDETTLPGYTLIDPRRNLATFRQTTFTPRAELLSDASESLWVLLATAGSPSSKVEQVSFADFTLVSHELPAGAASLGEAPGAQRIVLHYPHGEGRVSTIAWDDDGEQRTLSGFNLVNRIRE